MSRTSAFLALALSLSTASACDEVDDGAFALGDDITLRGFGGSGLLLNTSAIGDHLLHELDLRGGLHENVKLAAVYIRTLKGKKTVWTQLDEVWSVKGELFGRSGDSLFAAQDFVGSRWEVFTYGSGVTQRQMTIHSYRWDATTQNHKYAFAYPMDPSYGKHHYDKYAKPIDGTTLLPLCAQAGGDIEAVLYEHTHVDMKTGGVDEQQHILNIACLGGALGKSAEWGYRPYEIGHYGFQGIVRTLRADYCGDGDSWTKPGTAIDLEDTWGIHKFSDPSRKTEAIWTPEGALCVTLPRRPEFGEIDCGGWTLKDCGDYTLDSVEDARFWTKTP